MGIESFYLQFSLEDNLKRKILNTINETDCFKEVLDYSRFEVENIISASLVSFFPACEILFSLCKNLSSSNKSIIINSLNESHDFDFIRFIDFFEWVYNIWQNKLNSFNQSWGGFLLNPKLYYKTRRKLKKYYKKFKINE